MSRYKDCIVFLLAKAYQKAHAATARTFKPMGLTPSQQLLLEAVFEEEGMTAGEISARLRLDSATLSGVLDRMADSGWITKTPDEKDRRFLRVYPTPKAREVEEALNQRIDQLNDELLAEFSLEEKLLFKRLLKGMAE